ncbi:MAG: response regulator [Proteobacteria bacterium]|nr:response regulator [Pseudomonadota bacterium]MCP4917213.1 response regulator [Pseudomonadota bacterium]
MAERQLTLLVVDDDQDDQELFLEALNEVGFEHRVQFLNDGEELLARLQRTGEYDDTVKYPDPNLVVLDLQMPRVGGLEVLAALHDNEKLWRLPVVVMTTSWSEDDISRAYDMGVNAFLMKPVLYNDLVEQVRSLVDFWCGHAELPTL